MAADKSAAKTDDGGAAEVTAKINAAAEKGYFGETVDERDRADYTLKGSVARAGENLDN